MTRVKRKYEGKTVQSFNIYFSPYVQSKFNCYWGDKMIRSWTPHDIRQCVNQWDGTLWQPTIETYALAIAVPTNEIAHMLIKGENSYTKEPCFVYKRGT